ncbi:MAG: hypothetical protein II825_02145 [Paludibacteraceae bacterium]|nr:hypothetical protein [Paludibacteraceae bacterium]
MKNRLLITLLCVMSLAMTVQANDYLEQQKHYTVMSMGEGVLRFYIPVWVYGRANDYYLWGSTNFNGNHDSYLWYQMAEGSDQSIHRIASVAGVQRGLNTSTDDIGEGYMCVHSGSGIIRSTYDGQQLVLTEGDESHWKKNAIRLKRKDDDDHKHITYITFDWYPPSGLKGKKFKWGMSAAIYKQSSGNESYYYNWGWPDIYTGGDIPQSPQLYEPYLYTLDAEGTTGYGCAAVQYVVYQDPISYHTSLNPRERETSDRSGTIVIPTKDTVQRFVSATFQTYINKTAETKQTLKTNEVHIPAYHRVHDLRATEDLDAHQRVTGKVNLSWEIHNPAAQELIEGDVFEIQRAFQSDFSDAQSIGVIPYSEDSTVYHYTDNPLQAMREAEANPDSLDQSYSKSCTIYTYNEEDYCVNTYLCKLTSNKLLKPGRSVYYRVRRASSSIWGWKHDFAKVDSLLKNNYLAPLALDQPDYSLDPDFDTNRKVHLYFKLSNQPITVAPETIEQCEYKTELANNATLVELQVEPMFSGQVPESEIQNYSYELSYVLPGEDYRTVYHEFTFDHFNERKQHVIPTDSREFLLRVKYNGYYVGKVALSTVPFARVGNSYTISVAPGRNPLYVRELRRSDELTDSIKQAWVTPLNDDSIRSALYTEIQKELASQYPTGKAYCNWDNNARLWIRRTLVETGEVLETPVPADSVKIAEDGSWSIHAVDIANRPCVHYQYEVWMDQTNSSLKVMNLSDLRPKRLSGPDIYYNSTGKIENILATQGTDRYGVQMTWSMGPGGVDDYLIERREQGAESYDSLTVVDAIGFRDTHTATDKRYDYRIISRYTCNGTTTTDTATCTGWRSPYGKIQGRVHYSDGMGCAGVDVSLTSEGMDPVTVKTNAAGEYVFDNLLYGHNKEYTVTPTSSYATFHFNNTTIGSATVTLSEDNPVADELLFENISSVRFSGRVLYENTTIPVRDANLLLDGKMVSTGSTAYKTDGSGNFSIQVPLNHPFSIQVIKPGHTFAGDGFVRIDGDSLLRLEKALDGVRVYDQTRVRLTGRIVGGQNQADKILGFGLSTNNLGDDLQLVLELEGDNISQIVHDPQDPTLDTIRTTVKQYAIAPYDTVLTGTTNVILSKKRIIIRPDQTTGEYCADLWPVKYKITQATAKGYSTLYAEGKTGETLDMLKAAEDTVRFTHQNHEVTANAVYSITYHSPIEISCIQLKYGMEVPYYGEESIERQSIDNSKVKVPLAKIDESNNDVSYLFGAPVFNTGTYSFRATAHEDYYYNNNPLSVRHEEVRIKNGVLKVYNGLHDGANTQIKTIQMDANGEALFNIPIDYVSFIKTGESALRPLNLSVEYQGNYIEHQAFRAYVMGNKAKGRDFITSTTANIVLLDVLRDPPGSNSTAYVESGTTYKYSYSSEVKFNFGLNVTVGYGTSANLAMGTYSGTGLGIFSGYLMNMSTVNKISIPVQSTYYSKHSATYTFGVNEKIETEVDHGHTGEMDDIYIGAVQNLYYGLTDAVKPIDSLTYAAFAPQFANGAMQVVDSARAADGKKWYLVIGLEREVGTYINSTFAYTHDYIENTLLPKLKRDRDALLLTLDSATVQSMANAQKKCLYWSKVAPEDENFASDGYYRQIRPAGVIKVQADEVAGYNRAIAGWIGVMIQNENEKINAIHGYGRNVVGNWSVSGGSKVSYSENYEYSNAYSKYVDYPGASANLGQGVISSLGNAFGKTVVEMIGKYVGNTYEKRRDPFALAAEAPEAKWVFELTPLLDLDFHQDPSDSESHTRKAGFTLRPDEFGYMDVSVYRAIDDGGFNHDAGSTIDFIGKENMDYKYGSFVYYLNGGASRCPWEPADSTHFYEPKVPLGNGTLNLEKQRIDIDVHERSNVPVDKPAIFTLTMSNESEHEYGGGQEALGFQLKLAEGSNPKGAKIMIDGLPLSGDGRTIKLKHGQIIQKTMEVSAGQGYDFEDIVLELASPCDRFNKSRCTFSVHYMPVSCEVNIAAPHDKWTMNTLSPQDSSGYYLPVVIDGFDVNYKNFDHIELQYKLSKQSDDGWVNLCSYYYSDSLYQAASGTKAMITGGRIENIRFYGERDPMEQEYDLRAVSFCRHGNGFISRVSEVRSGIKDTRVPRVFGAAQPADAILGVGNDLKLRFNEPIAGNYLDEDNNFQIIGMTNATGITTGTSLHFADETDSRAVTKVERSLTNKSFTIDMMVRPRDAQTVGSLFFSSKPNYNYAVQLGCAEGSLFFFLLTDEMNVYSFRTNPGVLPGGVFSRVIAVYDNDKKEVKLYVGTEQKPFAADGFETIPKDFVLRGSAPLEFGSEFDGDMMEARVWTKALTQDEIAATHMKYLTGYERDLMAYYRMDEGRGNELTDRANGATLYCTQTSWNHRKGISVALKADEQLKLDGNLLGRSKVYDESIMIWFKTTSANGDIFSAGRTDEQHGTLLAIENGRLMLHSDSTQWLIGDGYANNEWHHVVLAINRTMNNAAVYVDGKVLQSFSASLFGSISGAMYLGGNGFEGNIDDLCFFEQALPKYMVEGFDNLSPSGDEMGLFGYLPFEEMKENDNGIIELVYSPNDQRVFRDGDGNIVNKIVPLVLTANSEDFADKTNYAPTRNHGQLTKMNFDWSFNGDELLINLNMADREINKQTIYVTVRDVEDLNGNPMASPVSWVAFVDRNALKWNQRTLRVSSNYDMPDNFSYYVDIINQSGRRHQYTIESLPDWLTVNEPSGSMNALEEKQIRLTFDANLPVGVYNDQIYLTDEEGLAEPLIIEYTVEANPPYESIDRNKYQLNMSVCAVVKIAKAKEVVFDTDENDIVYAMYKNECVGMAHISFDAESNKSKLFMTVYGNDAMNRKQIRFQLWQASTGKVYDLRVDRNVLFAHGFVYGCGDGQLLVMTTNGNERQTIQLQAGWNWTSFNLIPASNGAIADCMIANDAWKEGDQIKNPNTRQFTTYNDSTKAFVGTLSTFDYKQIYMISSQDGNTMHISGTNLPADSMKIKVRGDGQWSPMPCLLKQVTPVTEALSGYYDRATPGDMLKSHDHFAYFSEDKKWEGDLTTMRPGEGYLFRRLAPGTVEIAFYNRSAATAPKRESRFSNPKVATNMTMIARVEGLTVNGERLAVYVGDELAGVAEPMDSLYFITIQSDKAGELRFECNGERLTVNGEQIRYVADAHHGTPKEPIILKPADETGVYKIIENNHVIIIRNKEKYDVTGKKLE